MLLPNLINHSENCATLLLEQLVEAERVTHQFTAARLDRAEIGFFAGKDFFNRIGP
jgi:hypothetical protein